MTISVIIPVRNGAAYLRECLEALSRQVPPAFETIVVDDGSSDGSAEIAELFPCTLIRSAGSQGSYAARNRGARQASGWILLFVDADVCLHPGSLARIARTFEREPKLTALFGTYDQHPASPTFVSRYRNLLHAFTHRTSRPDAATFWTGCGAILRDVFERYGGFQEEPGFLRDIELGMRLNRFAHQIRLDRDLEVCHLKRWTLPDMVRTDVLRRAAPWTELILGQGRMPDDLNLRWRERAAVILAGLFGLLLMLAGALGSPRMAISAAAVLPLYIGCTWPLLVYLRGIAGPRFAIQAIPLHLLYHWSCAAGFVVGAARFAARTPQSAKRFSHQFAVQLFIPVLLGITLFDIAANLEHWPFSNYPMYSGRTPRLLSRFRLYAISGTGESPLTAADIAPFDDTKLDFAMRSLLANRPESIPAALQDRLKAYTRHLSQLRGAVPAPNGLRLYRVDWRLDGNDPPSRTLVAEVHFRSTR